MCDVNEMTGYPSVDKPWLKYYTEEDLRIEIPRCTVYQNIYENNKDYPKDIALNYYGNKIRYSVLFDMVEKCAKTLRTIGIKPGDCVTMCTAGVPEAIYTVLACSRIGAIANFINPMFTTEQMIDRINDTEAEWILILDAMYPYIEKSLSATCIRNVVIIPATNSVSPVISRVLYLKSAAKQILKGRVKGGQKYYSWKEFVRIGDDYSDPVDVAFEKKRAVVMVYSSGTTGASKGILLTNDGINATIMDSKSDRFPHRRGDVFLQMIPVWFSTGIVHSMLLPLCLGLTVAPEPVFNVDSFIKDLKKIKPEITLVATSIWVSAIKNRKFKDIDLSNMKYPMTGGEKILPDTEKELNDALKEHGCETTVLKGYGMCELGGKVSDSIPFRNGEKLGSVGIPMLNVSVSAFDVNTNAEMQIGERGEIRVSSPARMKEYYKNPEATSKYFMTDNSGNIWGCTGDIGYVDEDGVIFILGRATDSVKREDGNSIYMFDIEEEIIKEEAVNQCKVVDIEEDGETILVSHIVFEDGVTDADSILQRINDRIKNALPEYMIPQYYKIRQSMPVNSNGKRDIEALKRDREGLIKLNNA